MTSKTATPSPPAVPTDPWAEAHAPWIPAPGTRAERAKAQQFQKPRLWEHILRDDRARLAAVARDVLDGPAFDFPGRLLEQLRARAAAAQTAAEREPWHRLEGLVSRHLGLLPDLLTRVQSLPAEAAR